MEREKNLCHSPTGRKDRWKEEYQANKCAIKRLADRDSSDHYMGLREKPKTVRGKQGRGD